MGFNLRRGLRKRLATTHAERVHCQVLLLLVCVTLPVPTGPGWDKIAAQVEVVQARKQLWSLQTRTLAFLSVPQATGPNPYTAGAALNARRRGGPELYGYAYTCRICSPC